MDVGGYAAYEICAKRVPVCPLREEGGAKRRVMDGSM